MAASLLPVCHHYCEPFSGSAAVLLNRETSPVETYNDIDGDVVNFFRVLRDNHDELIRLVSLTPFSREEFCNAIYSPEDDISNIERARRFYIRARQTRTGRSDCLSRKMGKLQRNKPFGNVGCVSRWLGGIESLEDIAARLIRVQIENRPANDVIRLYDNPDTLFYCDPPYLHTTRGDTKSYGFEMDEEQYAEFSKVVNDCTAMVAISGYDHPMMDEFFKPSHWTKIYGQAKTIHSTKGLRTEVLWINYKHREPKVSYHES
jgi:DNA adenine methylase